MGNQPSYYTVGNQSQRPPITYQVPSPGSPYTGPPQPIQQSGMAYPPPPYQRYTGHPHPGHITATHHQPLQGQPNQSYSNSLHTYSSYPREQNLINSYSPVGQPTYQQPQIYPGYSSSYESPPPPYSGTSSGTSSGQDLFQANKNYKMAAPTVDENFLKQVFQQVDKDHSNAINAVELQSCLSNGTWEPFNGETVRLMITLFDRSHKGQLNYEEFKQLWKYIEDWRQCFQSFDKDKSGFINKDEIKQALTTFGYQLSDKFYDLVLHKFVKSGQGRIYFDDFIQICVSLQTITAAFRHHDTDSDGVITIKYEDFLSLVFSMR